MELIMEEPHTYHSREIANAVNVGGGVDDHLIDNRFVKVSEYNDVVRELEGQVRYNFDKYYDEREDAYRAKWKYCISRIKNLHNDLLGETDQTVIDRRRFQIGRLYRLSLYYKGFIVHKLNTALYIVNVGK